MQVLPRCRLLCDAHWGYDLLPSRLHSLLCLMKMFLCIWLSHTFHSGAFQSAWTYFTWRCCWRSLAAMRSQFCQMFNVYLFYRNCNDLTLEFCICAACVLSLQPLSDAWRFFGGLSVESLWLLCLYLSSATCLLLPVSALRSTTKPSVHYPACRNYIINKAANNPRATPVPRP